MCRIFDNETIQWIIIHTFYNNNYTKPQLLWNYKQSSRIIILLQIRKRKKLFLNVYFICRHINLSEEYILIVQKIIIT